MPTRPDLAKLCFGRIIYADVPKSPPGVGSAGVHYGVVTDDDEFVSASDYCNCLMVSSNTDIFPEYMMPVPKGVYLPGKGMFLKGHIHCSWSVPVLKSNMVRIESKLSERSTRDALVLHRRYIEEQVEPRRNTPK